MPLCEFVRSLHMRVGLHLPSINTYRDYSYPFQGTGELNTCIPTTTSTILNFIRRTITADIGRIKRDFFLVVLAIYVSDIKEFNPL